MSFLTSCPFCLDGLLRPWTCPHCSSVVALCDECELLWWKPLFVIKDRTVPADGGFPTCPCCGEDLSSGGYSSHSDLEESGLLAIVKVE